MLYGVVNQPAARWHQVWLPIGLGLKLKDRLSPVGRIGRPCALSTTRIAFKWLLFFFSANFQVIHMDSYDNDYSYVLMTSYNVCL